MENEVLVALFALIGTALGTLASARLTLYRIEQLEKKMDKHNNVIERTYKLEQRICGVEEDIVYLRKSN